MGRTVREGGRERKGGRKTETEDEADGTGETARRLIGKARASCVTYSPSLNSIGKLTHTAST